MHEDIEKILFSEEEISAKTKELGVIISADYNGKRPIIAGVLKGAFVFTADLVRNISIPVQMDFLIAKSYGDSAETSGSVKLIKDLENDISGRHVILVEDIIDSGLTMKRLFEVLKKRNPASLKLCSLLSKPDRRLTEIKIDYCGWDIPDEFVVGYGLDYAERYRNLPYIGVLKRELYT